MTTIPPVSAASLLWLGLRGAGKPAENHSSQVNVHPGNTPDGWSAKGVGPRTEPFGRELAPKKAQMVTPWLPASCGSYTMPAPSRRRKAICRSMALSSQPGLAPERSAASDSCRVRTRDSLRDCPSSRAFEGSRR